MTFKQFVAEGFSYMYETQIPNMVNDFKQDVEYHLSGVSAKINALKEGDWFENTIPREDMQHYNRLIKWFELFHEAEYKRNILKRYGIECKECDKIIQTSFLYFKRLFDIVSNKWLLNHNCINSFFDFRNLKLEDWDMIESHSPTDTEIERYKTPDNWPGNNPNDFIIYKKVIKPLKQRIDNANTYEDKIIAITLILNALHQNGYLLDYGGFDQKDLERLSNLPTNKWNGELYKEFQIKL